MIRELLLLLGASEHLVCSVLFLLIFWRSRRRVDVSFLVMSALCAGCALFFIERLWPLHSDAWVLYAGAVTGLVVLASIISFEVQRRS
jgi:hypothetical protein